jgi:hypothetical protein
VALDPFEHSPGLRRWTNQTWSIETHHGLARERCSQRTDSPVNSISIRHLVCQITPFSGRRRGSFSYFSYEFERCLRQLADVSKGKTDQAVVTAGHLEHDVVADGLFGGEPMKVERLLGGLAFAVDRDDVGKADRVVTRVVEA